MNSPARQDTSRPQQEQGRGVQRQRRPGGRGQGGRGRRLNLTEDNSPVRQDTSRSQQQQGKNNDLGEPGRPDYQQRGSPNNKKAVQPELKF